MRKNKIIEEKVEKDLEKVIVLGRRLISEFLFQKLREKLSF